MWDVTRMNIGGIRSGSATIEDGLNVIQASNFRGKSSFIAALRTAIGATGQYDPHPLTEGTKEGRVTLEAADHSHEVLLERVSPETVTQSGTPYITDETDQVCARLFACLDEANPIRKAVRNGEDLTELLQAPLNIADIDAQIATLKSEQREIDQQIAEAERAGEQLPTVQETVTELEGKLDELQSQREELASEEAEKEQIGQLRDEISAKSETLATIGGDIERLENEITRKSEQITQKKEQKAELDVPADVDEEQDADALEQQIDALERQIALVEDLYRANQNVVEAGEIDVITDVDRSIAADEFECWVCGQQTTGAEIDEYISGLQSKVTDLRDQKADVQAELAELEARRRERRQVRQEKQRLANEIRQLTADIDEKQGLLEENRERKAAIEREISDLREELEQAESEYNEELTDVKTEIRTTESKLQSEREKLESLEQNYNRLDELERERGQIQAELENLRNRKKNAQETLKEQFNSIIADIIEAFQPGFSSARLVLKTDIRGEVENIDLELARDIDDTGQRTSVDTLSEGEVELIGLMVALAGYHAFDVESTAPFILIDGITELAAEHLRSVATYLEDTTDVLVTTAYPEAGEFDGHVVSPDEWDVVSDTPATTS